MEKTNEAGVKIDDQGAPLDTGVKAEDSGAPQNQQDNTDWKALYTQAHTEAENYKTALSQKRQIVNKADPVEDDKPLTRADLQQAVSESVVPIIAQSKVEQELGRQVTDPEKRKLVKLYYETRVRQMGTSDDAIRNDISAALAIADAHKIKQASAEIKRKQDMQTSPNLSGSSSEPHQPSKNHKFSDQQVAVLTARAKALGMEPTKFIEQTWRNQSR